MSRAPRFEVVRTDAGWHARFVAANVHVGGTHSVDIRYGSETHQVWSDAHRLEVRLVDERSKP